MWEPRHLTTLWTFITCYRDSFLKSVYFVWCSNRTSLVFWKIVHKRVIHDTEHRFHYNFYLKHFLLWWITDKIKGKTISESVHRDIYSVSSFASMHLYLQLVHTWAGQWCTVWLSTKGRRLASPTLCTSSVGCLHCFMKFCLTSVLTESA
jgi:hypothetical protein